MKFQSMSSHHRAESRQAANQPRLLRPIRRILPRPALFDIYLIWLGYSHSHAFEVVLLSSWPRTPFVPFHVTRWPVWDGRREGIGGRRDHDVDFFDQRAKDGGKNPPLEIWLRYFKQDPSYRSHQSRLLIISRFGTANFGRKTAESQERLDEETDNEMLNYGLSQSGSR